MVFSELERIYGVMLTIVRLLVQVQVLRAWKPFARYAYCVAAVKGTATDATPTALSVVTHTQFRKP
jgi:hypothetical protein